MHKFVLLVLLIAASNAARVKHRTITNETQWDNQYFQASEEQESILQGNENYTKLPKRARCPWHLMVMEEKSYYFQVQDADKHMAIKLVRNDRQRQTTRDDRARSSVRDADTGELHMGPHISVFEGYSWKLNPPKRVYRANAWRENCGEKNYSLVAHENEAKHKYEINFRTDVKSVGLDDIEGAAVLSIEYNNGTFWHLAGGAWLLPNCGTKEQYDLNVQKMQFSTNSSDNPVVPTLASAGLGMWGGVAISGAVFASGALFFPFFVVAGTGAAGALVGSGLATVVSAKTTQLINKKKWNKSLKYVASVKMFDKLWCQQKFFKKCSQTRMCSKSNSECLCKISDRVTTSANPSTAETAAMTPSNQPIPKTAAIKDHFDSDPKNQIASV